MKTLLISSVLVFVLRYVKCDSVDQLLADKEDDAKRDTSCLKTDVNEYLDNVLEKARKELPDPMRLPPRTTFVELNDGLLWGLSNITRLGDTEVTCDGNTIIIKGKITTDELKGRYTWTKKKSRSDQEGNVVFISNDFEADLKVLIKKKKGEITYPRLRRFEIKKFKDAKIEISGANYLGWAIGEITTKFSRIFQRNIAKAIQDPMTEALEREMREIKIE